MHTFNQELLDKIVAIVKDIRKELQFFGAATVVAGDMGIPEVIRDLKKKKELGLTQTNLQLFKEFITKIQDIPSDLRIDLGRPEELQAAVDKVFDEFKAQHSGAVAELAMELMLLPGRYHVVYDEYKHPDKERSDHEKQKLFLPFLDLFAVNQFCSLLEIIIGINSAEEAEQLSQKTKNPFLEIFGLPPEEVRKFAVRQNNLFEDIDKCFEQLIEKLEENGEITFNKQCLPDIDSEQIERVLNANITTVTTLTAQIREYTKQGRELDDKAKPLRNIANHFSHDFCEPAIRLRNITALHEMNTEFLQTCKVLFKRTKNAIHQVHVDSLSLDNISEDIMSVLTPMIETKDNRGKLLSELDEVLRTLRSEAQSFRQFVQDAEQNRAFKAVVTPAQCNPVLFSPDAGHAGRADEGDYASIHPVKSATTSRRQPGGQRA